jgi:hypothetical protein
VIDGKHLPTLRCGKPLDDILKFNSKFAHANSNN